MVGAMTEALQVEPEHRVLEIGTGSGYQAAVLAELCRMVYSVELVAELSRQARRTLSRLGYRNVRLRSGNGQDGWPEFAPYDRLLVTAGSETMPHRLVGQLVDGGRIVVPVAGVLTVGIRHGQRLVQRALFGCVFVPFVDPDRKR
jgi:protein-L-isoaspartate(D-aspartate) O-methyltransferase